MIHLKYEVPSHVVTVLVNTDDVIEAQRLVKASDPDYQKMVYFEKLTPNEVFFVSDVRRN